MEHHFTTFAPCLRTDVHNVVCLSHHVFVVFYDDHRVAQVAQLLQRRDEPLVVALVQSDAGLIQNIEHVHQLTAYLRRQTDTLTLAARQRCRLAVQCQIVQSHIEQEIQTRAYLLQYLCGNLLLLVVQVLFTLVQPCAQLVQVHRCQFGDVLVPDLIRQRLAVQSQAVTLGTFPFGQELVGPFLSARRVVVLHHRAQVFHHTVEIDEVVARRVHQILADAHRVQRAIEYLVHRFVGNVLYPRFQRTVILLQNGVNLPEYHLVLVFPQRCDTAFIDGVFAVGNDLVDVYLVDISQPLAARTSPLRRIEREGVRRWFAVGDARRRTHQPA